MPPSLPLYVLVRFDSYRDPCIVEDLFPVVPVSETFRAIVGEERESNTRRQIPLSVAHAMTAQIARIDFAKGRRRIK